MSPVSFLNHLTGVSEIFVHFSIEIDYLTLLDVFSSTHCDTNTNGRLTETLLLMFPEQEAD